MEHMTTPMIPLSQKVGSHFFLPHSFLPSVPPPLGACQEPPPPGGPHAVLGVRVWPLDDGGFPPRCGRPRPPGPTAVSGLPSQLFPRLFMSCRPATPPSAVFHEKYVKETQKPGKSIENSTLKWMVADSVRLRTINESFSAIRKFRPFFNGDPENHGKFHNCFIRFLGLTIQTLLVGEYERRWATISESCPARRFLPKRM